MAFVYCYGASVAQLSERSKMQKINEPSLVRRLSFIVGLGILLTNIKGREGEQEIKIKERIAFKTSPTTAVFPISMRSVTLRGHA